MDMASALASLSRLQHPFSRQRSGWLLAGTLALGAIPALAQSTSGVDGVWSGTAQSNGQQVPLKLEIHGEGDHLQAALLNGKQRSASSSGSYTDGHLALQFDYYANSIDASLKDGTLTGTFSSRGRSIPFTAQRNTKAEPSSPNPVNIGGDWEVEVKSSKNESAWTLHVKQSGPNVEAVIQRIDGDTGSLFGEWRNGQYEVSHFTAAGPSYAVLRPQADGTLQLVTPAHGGTTQTWTARRPQQARAAGLASPDDPLQHTRLSNPSQPLAFSGKTLDGKTISNTDPDFKGKVVIVSIGGSWCPNCHDEAPLLESLYRKYHDRGLDIVELSFEEENQLANPTRLRAMIQQLGLTYQVLLTGTPDQLNEKITGVEHLDSWPTTFFIGRDGRVKAIHTGFAGPATGDAHRDLEKETDALVKKLLS
ncbi:TlpA disulfide reductase family protein [Silvibacterium sp.]|uniref:TlpA disulfide reductase family protein n=1 Tax=Silvibacterium sp. TaxID=1964179 RepID=UPI0039E3FB0F